MNFSSKPGTALIEQKATYHLAPNFTTPPFPRGPLTLGTVVEDVKAFATLGVDRVAIPDEGVYRDEKSGVSAFVTRAINAKAGFLARVLEQSLGGEASLRGLRSAEDAYTIDRLETIYFHPHLSYLAQVMKLADVEGFLEYSGYSCPVYLITGLKIARGAKIRISRDQEGEVSASLGAAIPGVVGNEIGANAGAGRASGVSTTWTEPSDFVLGIQVLKLYHRKKLFSRVKVLKKKLAMPAGGLVDDDELKYQVIGDREEEAGFVVGELNEGDFDDVPGGVEIHLDEDVAWIVPSGAVQNPSPL